VHPVDKPVFSVVNDPHQGIDIEATKMNLYVGNPKENVPFTSRRYIQQLLINIAPIPKRLQKH
jgi:hypothetical protein